MIEIPLRGKYGLGRVAIIDDIDSEWAEYGWFVANGYVVRTIFIPEIGAQRHERLHRTLLGLKRGDGVEADHWNGDKLDNRRSNLFIVDHDTNMQNQTSKRGSSKYRGVTWHKAHGKWVAGVKTGGRKGKRQHLGYFDDEAEAGRVASEYRRKVFHHTNEERRVRD